MGGKFSFIMMARGLLFGRERDRAIDRERERKIDRE